MSTNLSTGSSFSVAPFGYHLLHSFDLLGTIVFASMGALMAYDQRLNGLTALLYAGLTALGGGTLRDILLGQQPVFWMRSPTYLFLSLIAGATTFILAHYIRLRREYFYVADALSLAVFTIVGIQVTLTAFDTPVADLFSRPLIFVLPMLMGLMTGVAGGLIRDVIAAQPPYVLQQPVCAIASLISGSIYLAFARSQIPEVTAIMSAIAAAILILIGSKILMPESNRSCRSRDRIRE